MDVCNFPELLALDLETAESIFAAKQMTAGVPRPLDSVLEENELRELLSQQLLDDDSDSISYAYTRLRPPQKKPQQEQRRQQQQQQQQQQQLQRQQQKQQLHGRSKSVPHVPRITTNTGDNVTVTELLSRLAPVPVSATNSESDTKSVDSFEAATKQGTLVASRRAMPEPQLAMERQKWPRMDDLDDMNANAIDALDALDNEKAVPGAPLSKPQLCTTGRPLPRSDGYTRTRAHSDITRLSYQADSSGRLGRESQESCESRESHESQESQESRDSHLSYRASDADDNDSLASDAGSVSSFGVPIPLSSRGRQQSVVTAATSVTSSDCRTSAQSHTLSALGPSSPILNKRESSASSCGGRHVEFSDNHDVIIASDSTESCHASKTASNKSGLGGMARSGQSSQRLAAQSSWLNDDDDQDDDLDNEEEAINHRPYISMLVRSKREAHLPQRPKTSAGRTERMVSQSRRLSDWTEDRKRFSQASAPSSVTTVPVPKRRSSLKRDTPHITRESYEAGRDPADAWLIRRLRHFVSMDHVSSARNSFGRAMSPAAGFVEEKPLRLEQTVYRQPTPTPTPSVSDSSRMMRYSSAFGQPREPYRNQYEHPLEQADAEGHGKEAENGYLSKRGSSLTAKYHRATDLEEGTYDEAEDKILMATVMPCSREVARSVRSGRSLLSLDDDGPGSTTDYQHNLHPAIDEEEADEAGSMAADRPTWVQQGIDKSFVSVDDAAQERATAVADEGDEPFPYGSFYQPGVVGIPLPRDVVETLRVSVSCFPETMLSLSSFSIQTIRSYSRKVRRCRPQDMDGALRVLIGSVAPPTSMQSGPPIVTPFVPPLRRSPSPTSPMSGMSGMSTMMRGNTAWDGASSFSRTSGNSSLRFWKLSRKLGAKARMSPSLSSLNGRVSGGGGYGASSRSTTSRQAMPGGTSMWDSDEPEGKTEEEQGKGSGLCFRRIFPTGSDYLCDALYAHVLAFNYISLLCPPSAQEAQEAQETQEAQEIQETRETLETLETATGGGAWVAGPGANSRLVTSTLSGGGEHEKRQTIRVYVGSDVTLPTGTRRMSVNSEFVAGPILRPMEMDDGYDEEDVNGPLAGLPSHIGSSWRGVGGDDDNRMISRKAASLLGMTSILEPETGESGKNNKRGWHDTGSMTSGLSRRYNSLRQRHLRAVGTSLLEVAMTASSAATTAKGVTLASKTKKPPISCGGGEWDGDGSEWGDEGDWTGMGASANEGNKAPVASVGVGPMSLSVRQVDGQMRELQAGLYGCISRLVATLKLTTGQMGDSTLLTEEKAQAVDPLLMRTLCELVRSQEEQI